MTQLTQGLWEYASKKGNLTPDLNIPYRLGKGTMLRNSASSTDKLGEITGKIDSV